MNFVIKTVVILFSLLMNYSAHAGSTRITIGTGSLNGVYYPVGSALCRFLNHKEEGEFKTRCSVRPTRGSMENLHLLGNPNSAIQRSEATRNLLDFAIVQSDVARDAGVFEPDKGVIEKDAGNDQNWSRKVIDLHREYFILIVREDADFANVESLANAKVYAGEELSGHCATARRVFKDLQDCDPRLRVAKNRENERQTSLLTLAERLCSNEGEIDASEAIDAIAQTIGIPALVISEIKDGCDGKIKFLKVAPPQQNQNGLEGSPYSPEVLYLGTDAEGKAICVETFSVRAWLVERWPANSGVDFKTYLEEGANDFATLHPALRDFAAKSENKIVKECMG